MDYQHAWETLKKIITAKKASYEDGSMCSMSEAIHKESVCKDILSTMDELEKLIKKMNLTCLFLLKENLYQTVKMYLLKTFLLEQSANIEMSPLRRSL